MKRFLTNTISTFIFVFLFSNNLNARPDIEANVIADFSFEVYEEMGRPNIIKFTNLSSGDQTEFLWEFGDGSTSNDENPIHTFPKNDNFEVKLYVANNESSDDIIKTVIIDVSLSVNFSFQLDTNNVVPNTFIFNANVNGSYDYLDWSFGDQLTLEQTITHTFPQENTDYQIILSAIYLFNDTSQLKKSLVKGLTSYEYYNLGGQVILGDSLMNNPSFNGDSGIAVLYRFDNSKLQAVDTNYFNKLGYYWFSEKLKAQYIVQVYLSEDSHHFSEFAPTYIGNTTLWQEADIINLSKDKFREDVDMAEKSGTKGTHNFSGNTIDLIAEYNDQLALVCIHNLDNELIDFQYSKIDDTYVFDSLSNGHYLVSADITGEATYRKLIFIDESKENTYKNVSIQPELEIFPNPASDFTILEYDNPGDINSLGIQIIHSSGRIIDEQQFHLRNGLNYLNIDLSDISAGLLYLRFSNNPDKTIKLIHY